PPSPTAIYTLSLHDALPICRNGDAQHLLNFLPLPHGQGSFLPVLSDDIGSFTSFQLERAQSQRPHFPEKRTKTRGQTQMGIAMLDRKSTRLNSSHVKISYAV